MPSGRGLDRGERLGARDICLGRSPSCFDWSDPRQSDRAIGTTNVPHWITHRHAAAGTLPRAFDG
jgi:hypothetical protein